jgi:putative DNA primase/helicase
MSATIEAARGRWVGILAHFGIDESYLRNRHGPCPLCGGRDRYRFDDRNGTGSYYCHQCGPGDGMTLLRRFKGWSFGHAAAQIDAVIGRIPARPQADDTDAAHRLDVLQRLLEWSLASHLVSEYLHSRGLSIIPPALRGHSGLWHSESGRRWPAVVAPVRDPSGELRSVLRIFLGAPEPRKKLMPAVVTVRGCAVQLYAAAATMGVAEGVETACAAHELFKVPVWAALSANGLTTFQPPPGCQALWIFGDNDKNGVGQAAAHTLGTRITRTGIPVEIVMPPWRSADWLDELNQKEGT